MDMFSMLCVAAFTVCCAVFFYFLFTTVKTYMKCKSEKKDELPCPNTCNPGYECKQSDAPADFVIGEVVEEFSETEAMPELVPEAAEAEAKPEAEAQPEPEAAI